VNSSMRGEGAGGFLPVSFNWITNERDERLKCKSLSIFYSGFVAIP
jgi:hypothetical protein